MAADLRLKRNLSLLLAILLLRGVSDRIPDVSVAFSSLCPSRNRRWSNIVPVPVANCDSPRNFVDRDHDHVDRDRDRYDPPRADLCSATCDRASRDIPSRVGHATCDSRTRHRSHPDEDLLRGARRILGDLHNHLGHDRDGLGTRHRHDVACYCHRLDSAGLCSRAFCSDGHFSSVASFSSVAGNILSRAHFSTS